VAGSSQRRTIRATPADRGSSKSLTDQVYERLKDEILRAHRAPGELLLEPELVENYRVSKTPIREALRLLIQEDWVVVMPRKGYLVRPLRLEDVREIFMLRQLIEPGLAAEAARRAGPADVDRLRQHLQLHEHARDHLNDALVAASSFHLTLAELGGNARALRVLSGLLDEIRRLHHLMPVLEGRLTSRAEIEDHRQIIDALAAKRPDHVASLMREHLANAAQVMVGVFGGLPPKAGGGFGVAADSEKTARRPRS
jgi:DNA-binding GntR family transcriptional regulator